MKDTRRHFLACSGALLTATGARATTDAATLVLVNAVYPPLVNPPGHASGEGVDIDIAREALRRGGYTGGIELQWVPWKRALFMLERGLADFTTTINFSADRDRFLRWSNAYRPGKHYYFYTRKDSGLVLRRLSDLRGLRLALSDGFTYPQPVLEAATGQPVLGRNVAGAVQLVERGRADVVMATALAGAWEIRQLGMADLVDRQPLEYFHHEPTFMAFSASSPHTPAALAALNAGLAAMLRDGSIGRIEKRYLR